MTATVLRKVLQMWPENELVLLIGARRVSTWFLVNKCALLLESPVTEYVEEISSSLPVGIDVIGVGIQVSTTSSTDLLDRATDVIRILSMERQLDHLLMLFETNCDVNDGISIEFATVTWSGDTKPKFSGTVVDSLTATLVRCEGPLALSYSDHSYVDQLERLMQSDRIAFWIQLPGEERTGIAVDKRLQNLRFADLADFNSLIDAEKSSDPIPQISLSISLATCVSDEEVAESLQRSAALVHQRSVDETRILNFVVQMKFPILLCEADVNVYSGLKNVIQRQKSLVDSFHQRHTVANITSLPPLLSAYILCPAELTHPIALVYSDGDENQEHLVTLRRRLHRIWMISPDHPVFRKSNATASDAYSLTGHLIRVHRHVADPECGQTFVVEGLYAYHHYMQDGVSDSGWGCAYRSFQTIWSWFRLQGYTSRDVPSHSQIQEVLVAIGDKPKSFVGSKNWIGSMELSFCLSEMLQVDSRILTVSSGADLEEKARELSQHFLTQNTPVMIGGGMLAHTILGVSFDSSSGDCRFLVLDPHYTGEDNWQEVVAKGWCGWKTPGFWDKSSFYNLLLPVRPIGVI